MKNFTKKANSAVKFKSAMEEGFIDDLALENGDNFFDDDSVAIDFIDWSDASFMDIEKDLEDEFDEDACIAEVIKAEAEDRPDAMSLEEVLWDVPSLLDEVQETIRHHHD